MLAEFDEMFGELTFYTQANQCICQNIYLCHWPGRSCGAGASAALPLAHHCRGLIC